MKALKTIAPAALIGLLAAGTAQAAANDIALGAGISTLGMNLNLHYGLNDNFNVRGVLNKISLEADGEEDGIEYKGDLNGSTFGVMADYYPWADKGFRLTGGLYINNNEINLVATSPDSAEIGDLTYNIDGQVNSDVSFDNNALFVGLGWGNPLTTASRWSVMTELGLLLQGSPNTKIAVSGSATETQSGQSFTIGDGSARDDELQEQIAIEKKNLDDELDEFDMYPVFSVSLSYRF